MSTHLAEVLEEISSDNIKYGDLKKIAKEIKKDHGLAMDLWETGQYHPKLLAVLILDRKLIDEAFMDKVATDLLAHGEEEWKQVADWLFANQLNKSKKLISMVEKWMKSESPVLRKLFWTHQYRLRWTGKTEYKNTELLIDHIEDTIMEEIPPIQETMSMTAGWIGVYDMSYRNRIIKIGEDTGLYKDMKVSPGCTTWYLPEFIRIESEKRGL